MVKIVSVKFKNGGKPYYFEPGDGNYEKGMGVIVETSKGKEYAVVAEPVTEIDESRLVSPLKPVLRIATSRDEEQVKRNEERKPEALKIAQEKITARELDMKLVDCEFAFDGTKVTFYFTSDNRVDFRELIKDLSAAFRMRIELRQIGIREEIKMMGGLAPCGRECCCVRSIAEPKHVSVKMAKNQGLSLNPGKISGLCGRLMCCLEYENDYYADICKKVPKIGSEVDSPDGKGQVVNVNMLKMLVKIKIENGDSVTYRDYPVDELRFMRGNVMMGKTEEDEVDEADEAEILEDTDAVVKEEKREVKPVREKAERNKPRSVGVNGANNGGDTRKDNRKPRYKNKNRQKDGGANLEGGNNGKNAQQSAQKPAQPIQKQENGGGGRNRRGNKNKHAGKPKNIPSSPLQN